MDKFDTSGGETLGFGTSMPGLLSGVDMNFWKRITSQGLSTEQLLDTLLHIFNRVTSKSLWTTSTFSRGQWNQIYLSATAAVNGNNSKPINIIKRGVANKQLQLRAIRSLPTISFPRVTHDQRPGQCQSKIFERKQNPKPCNTVWFSFTEK